MRVAGEILSAAFHRLRPTRRGIIVPQKEDLAAGSELAPAATRTRASVAAVIEAVGKAERKGVDGEAETETAGPKAAGENAAGTRQRWLSEKNRL